MIRGWPRWRRARHPPGAASCRATYWDSGRIWSHRFQKRWVHFHLVTDPWILRRRQETVSSDTPRSVSRSDASTAQSKRQSPGSFLWNGSIEYWMLNFVQFCSFSFWSQFCKIRPRLVCKIRPRQEKNMIEHSIIWNNKIRHYTICEAMGYAINYVKIHVICHKLSYVICHKLRKSTHIYWQEYHTWNMYSPTVVLSSTINTKPTILTVLEHIITYNIKSF